MINRERTDIDTLWDFYRTIGGRQDTFLFKDLLHSTVARNTIGTGDGSEDEYQLLEVAGSQSFSRWDIINPSVSIWVNSVLQTETTHYTVDYTDSGIVTFVTPPPSAQLVEAAFQYYRRCRFDNDFVDVEKAYESGDVANLSFTEVKK